MGLIRFLLACGVVLCHTSTIMGYSPLSGNLAVQVFYIISGFYMAMILTEKYTGKGARYLFYTNRALKIYPVYFINLVLVVIISIVLYHFQLPGTLDFYKKYSHPSTITIIYLAIVNIAIIGLETLFLFGINKNGDLYFTKNFNATRPSVYNFAFNSIAWTVGLELTFYLIAPWLVKRKWLILTIIFLCSLSIRILCAIKFGDIAPWNYMFFPTQLMFFIAGIFSFKIYILIAKQNFNKILLKTFFSFFIVVILFYYQVFDESYFKNVVLFILTTLLIPFSFELTKKSRIDRFLGNLSYPIYISQFLVIRFTNSNKFPKIIDKGLTTLIIVIIFSLVIDRSISVYIERYRTKRLALFGLS